MTFNENIKSGFSKFSQVNRTLTCVIAKEHELSHIQLQFIEFLSKKGENDRNVSALSSEYELTKSTVSDSINSLIKKGIIEKKQSTKDKRSHILDITEKGYEILSPFTAISVCVDKLLESMGDNKTEAVSEFMTELIKLLYDAGIINYARLCYLCSNFEADKAPFSDKPHYCKLTKRGLSKKDIHLDCQSFSKKKELN